MKKFIAMMLVLALAVTFVACGSKAEEPVVEEDPTINEPAVMPEEDVPADMPEVDDPFALPEMDGPIILPDAELPLDEEPGEEMPEIEYMPEEKLAELSGLMEQLVAGINDELMVGTVEITADMYEYYALPALEGLYAVVSMPMIGSIAHEVVLVEVPEGTDAEAFATQMENQLNPMKWVCVQPENTWVKAFGNYVVSVMSTADMANGVLENCNTVFGA